MKKSAALLLGLAVVCACAPVQKTPKIAPDAKISTPAAVRVIVQWNIPIGDRTASTITALRGTVIREFASLAEGVYEIPGVALSTLAADTDVRYVSPDRQVKHKLATSAATINAPQVWNSGFNGTGVGVAVLDSGINSDDNLGNSPNIVYTNDFTPSAYINGKKAPSFGLDWFGHGHHVAGIISSNGKASRCGNCVKTNAGIAPGASLVNLKVLDSQGYGSDSQVIAAIDDAIQLKNTYKIRVMNLSLGRPVYESYTLDPLCQAVEAAWKAGIVVVVAAGNDGRDNSVGNQGYGTILAPGNDPYVLTVGAMKTMNTEDRSDDLVASYSSKGPTAVDHIVKPDIVAPGNLIESLLAQHGTLPLTNPQNAITLNSIQGGPVPGKPAVGGTVPTNPTQQPPQVNFGSGWSPKYYTLSGTSMAAAVVSGAVADVLQAHPFLTPDQVKILLMQTASKSFPSSSTVVDPLGNVYTDYYDMFTIGAGYLDLQAAMQGVANLPAAGNAMSPVSSCADDGTITVSFDLQSAWINQSVWPDRSIWGASAVWSSSVLTGTSILWDSRSIWGASTAEAARGLWGATSIWSTSADQSATTLQSESVEITGEN